MNENDDMSIGFLEPDSGAELLYPFICEKLVNLKKVHCAASNTILNEKDIVYYDIRGVVSAAERDSTESICLGTVSYVREQCEKLNKDKKAKNDKTIKDDEGSIGTVVPNSTFSIASRGITRASLTGDSDSSHESEPFDSLIIRIPLKSMEKATKTSFLAKKVIQDYARRKGLTVSGDTFGVLDSAIELIIDEACSRAKAGKRGSLKSSDFYGI